MTGENLVKTIRHATGSSKYTSLKKYIKINNIM